MKIQSLSIVVPNKECVNRCPFCVSRMVNSNIYPNRMDINDPHYDINVSEYMKRLRYVANIGCNTVMLTGTSEPQQNKPFLTQWAMLHKIIGSPFTNIEMQTTGLFLNDNRDYLRLLRNFVGVNTIALSVNSIDDIANNKILDHNQNISDVKIQELCILLKEYDFNIRICYNLNDSFNRSAPEWWFDYAKKCGANQITLRKLYSSEYDTDQGKWISDHKIDANREALLIKWLEDSKVIGSTMYGAPIYDVNGMSVIYDTDCMGKKPTTDVMKYLILRPNCKLYSSWDTPASLVF